LRLALHELLPRERERILHGQPHRVVRMAAARDSAKLVAAGEAAPADAMQLHAALAELAGRLVRDERGRHDTRLRLDLEVDAHVVAFDDVALCAVPPHGQRPRREAYPAVRERGGEQQADRDRIERARAEDPCGDVDDDAERRDCAAAEGHTGTGVFSSASRTSSAPSSPAERASGPRISRCGSTDGATALMSSGTR